MGFFMVLTGVFRRLLLLRLWHLWVRKELGIYHVANIMGFVWIKCNKKKLALFVRITKVFKFID